MQIETKKSIWQNYQKMCLVFLFVTGSFLVVGVGRASANTYYVDPVNGSDSVTYAQAQSSSTPTASIDKIINSNWASWGDTISLASGTYNGSQGIFQSGQANQVRYKYNIQGSVSNGPIVITSGSNASVTIDMPNNTSGGGTLFTVYGKFVLKGADANHKLHITNSNSVSSSSGNFLSIEGGLPINVTIQDVVFDWNNVNSSYPLFFGNISDYSPTITFNRVEIKNVGSSDTGKAFFRTQINTAGIVANVNFYSCLIHNAGYLITNINAYPINLTFNNNTVANIQTDHIFHGIYNGGTIDIQNNIFSGSSTFNKFLYSYYETNSQILTNWTVKGNDFYIPVTNDPGSDVDNLAYAHSELFPVDQTNFFINPNLQSDYSLPTGSYVSGRGQSSALPATDMNGSSWTGSDIGAIANPSATPTFPVITPNTIAFTGDSVSEGAGNRASVNGSLGDVVAVGNGTLGAGIGGSGGQDMKWYVDRAALTWHPKYIVFIGWHNNFLAASNNPGNLTAQQAAADTEVAMEKAEYWGMTPIFLGMGGSMGADPTTKPTAYNNAVISLCASHGWSCGSIVDYMQVNPNWNLASTSGGYYQTGGLAANVHPASNGYDLISEFAEYLLYPKSTIGTDHINIGAGARIYSDGKFRNLGTANANTANLSITPSSGTGSFNSADKSHWLDITPPTGEATLIWEESHKKWQESSDTLGTASTLHTIGDLTPDTYYNVKIDDSLAESNITGTDCTAGVCKSNGSGEITFTYTGGYSTHTFDIATGDNTPPTVTSGTTPKFHTDTTEVTLSLTTDENSTCHYSTNEADSFATMTPFTTTGTTSHTTLITNLTPNTYTYYALCQDSNTNETSYTLTFEIAPREENQSIDSNLKINSSTHNIENKKIYSDQKKITLKGQDDNMNNGEIKIYKDSHKWKTIHLNSKGEWNKGITLSNNISTDFKLKYFDQFGTELDSDSFTVNVDTQKPVFTTPFPTTLPKNQEIKFTATDNQKISYYRIKILDEAGRIIRNRKQTKDSYTIPKTIQPQASTIIVRAYDKAGNYAEQKAQLSSTTPSQPSPDYKGSGNTTAEVQGVSDVKEETQEPLRPDDYVATPPLSTGEGTDSSQPTKTSHWWNPWSWF